MNFLLVDFEYTFYKRPYGKPRSFFSEIIEIGAVKLEGETLKECGKLQNFVKPEFFPNHATDAMDFCMITPSDMKKAISFHQMVKKLSDLYVPGETYFVTWSDCDYQVLDICCQKYRIKNPINRKDCLDLAEAYRLMKGKDNTTSLMASLKELAIENNGLWHTAFDDAENTGKILTKLFELGWTPEAFFKAKSELIEARRLVNQKKYLAWLERRNKKYVV